MCNKWAVSVLLQLPNHSNEIKWRRLPFLLHIWHHVFLFKYLNNVSNCVQICRTIKTKHYTKWKKKNTQLQSKLSLSSKLTNVQRETKSARFIFVCRQNPRRLTVLLYTLREKFPSMRLHPASPWARNNSKSLQVFQMSFQPQTTSKWHKHLLCLCRWALTSCFPFILQIRMSFLLDSHVRFCRVEKEARH